MMLGLRVFDLPDRLAGGQNLASWKGHRQSRNTPENLSIRRAKKAKPLLNFWF
jgi:hypothetical protein